jgi:hypothetical protein
MFFMKGPGERKRGVRPGLNQAFEARTATTPPDEQVLTGKVGFCNLGSHHKPRFVCGLGSGIPDLQNKVEAYGF